MKFRNLILNKKIRQIVILSSTILFIIALFFVFNKAVISLIFTIMLIVLGCLSSQFSKLTGNICVGIEFIPFASILFFYTNGPLFGFLAAILMMTVSSLLVGSMQIDLFVSAAIFAVLAIISLFLPFGIVMNGIILMIIFNIISLIALTLIGMDIVKNIIYFIGSIIFNYILFKYFSQIIFSLLTGSLS